ncbi:MAG: DbpA RNA binding domain-containing protein, partial [Hymenobacteraceae bacterium]|nr:DbpA RNA binding domain-containing protein [Hymenobacteraceae bacterium]MDX5394647.1 DbpA RNA binding domain-containing protein [Hymenobacteraceae bacterium]MDX5442876.1 DbpA RNA binding domain-containing protein [Hymenobacteraceae bacterium]MDX5510678.1 DbpA RNA binding domain-containing protein [Hymenobacteraceae bacterium]
INKVQRLIDQDYTSLEIAAALLKMSMKEVKTMEKGLEAVKGMEGPKAGMDRLFVTVGKKDQVHPKDIIDALTDNTSIPVNKIGDIDLYDKFSFVEVAQEYTNEVVENMNRVEIVGKSVVFEKAQRKGAGGGGDKPFRAEKRSRRKEDSYDWKKNRGKGKPKRDRY